MADVGSAEDSTAGRRHDGLVTRQGDHSLVGGVGAVLAAGALVLVAGLPGLLAGVLVVAGWYLLSVPFALAVGHVLLAVTVPQSSAIGAFVLVEVGFVLLLVGPLVRGREDLRIVSAAIVVFLALLGVVAVGLRWYESVALAALALVVAASLLGYGLHRYELLRLGLVEP